MRCRGLSDKIGVTVLKPMNRSVPVMDREKLHDLEKKLSDLTESLEVLESSEAFDGCEAEECSMSSALDELVSDVNELTAAVNTIIEALKTQEEMLDEQQKGTDMLRKEMEDIINWYHGQKGGH